MVVTHYKGMTVADMTKLRGRIRDAGATYKVAKNRLLKLALNGTVYENMAGNFVGPTAIAYANDPVAITKVLVDFAKENENLKLIAAAMGSTVLDANGIQTLAKLPSLDELRAKLVGLLQAPATKLAGVLQAPAGQLARVTQAYASKG